MRTAGGDVQEDIFFYYLFIFGCTGSLSLRPFPGCSEHGLLFVLVCELVNAVASLVAEHRLQGGQASVLAGHRASWLLCL